MCPEFNIFEIDGYMIMIMLGIIAGLLIYRVYTDKKKIPYEAQRFFLLLGAVSIMLGLFSAYLFQSFYNFAANGYKNFKWQGLTFLGGLTGGVGMFFLLYYLINVIYLKKKYSKYLNVTIQAGVCGVILAHAIGRIGCFFAGCCYGRQMTGFPGITFPAYSEPSIHYTGVYNAAGELTHADPVCVLPTQLYEAAFLFGLFALLSYLYFKEYMLNLPIYALSYGVFRFFMEFLRNDHRGVLITDIMTPSQILSLLMVIGGVALLTYHIKYKKYKADYDFSEKDNNKLRVES